MPTEEQPQPATRTFMFTAPALFPEERARHVSPERIEAIHYAMSQGRSAMDATDDLVQAGGFGRPAYLGVVGGV